MSTLFAVQTQIPSHVTAGEQDSWTEDFAEYPNASYNVQYVFVAQQTPVDGRQTQTVVGVETGSATRTFTLPAAIKPGVYEWSQQIVRASPATTRIARRGCLVVAPDPAATPTVTDAQTKVTEALAAQSDMNSAKFKTTSFNGQLMTRKDTDELQSQLAFWQSRVIKENRELAALTTQVAYYNRCCGSCNC